MYRVLRVSQHHSWDCQMAKYSDREVLDPCITLHHNVSTTHHEIQIYSSFACLSVKQDISDQQKRKVVGLVFQILNDEIWHWICLVHDVHIGIQAALFHICWSAMLRMNYDVPFCAQTIFNSSRALCCKLLCCQSNSKRYSERLEGSLDMRGAEGAIQPWSGSLRSGCFIIHICIWLQKG